MERSMQDKQLETLKNLRAKIDEQIGGIEQKIEDEAEAKSDAYLNRLADLCREVGTTTEWRFIPTYMGVATPPSKPSIRIYNRLHMDEIWERLDPEILALSKLEDHGEPLNLARHTHQSCGDNDAERKVAGFSIYGGIEDLVVLCEAAELKNSFNFKTTYDATDLKDKINALSNQLEKLEARLEHEQCEWDNLYFAL